MSFNLPHYSRYKTTEKIVFNSVYTFGLYKTKQRLLNIKVEDLQKIKVGLGFAGRPDLISDQCYNTPYYAWVIVMINAPLNPLGWPRNGEHILIPTATAIDDISGE